MMLREVMARVGCSESWGRWENALVMHLKDFLGWKEQVKTDGKHQQNVQLLRNDQEARAAAN